MRILNLFKKVPISKNIDHDWDYVREFPSEENKKVIEEVDKTIKTFKEYHKRSARFKVINYINHLIMSGKIKHLRRLDTIREKYIQRTKDFANAHFSQFDERANVQELDPLFLNEVQCNKCFRFIDWGKVPGQKNYNPAHHPNYIGYEAAAKFASSEEEYRSKEWFKVDSITYRCPYCGAIHSHIHLNNWHFNRLESRGYSYTKLASDEVARAKKAKKVEGQSK